MSKQLLGWLALMMVVMGTIGIALGWRATQAERSGSSSEPDYRQVPSSASAKWLKSFTLTERSGRKVGTEDLKGKVYVTNFFFSTCGGRAPRRMAGRRRPGGFALRQRAGRASHLLLGGSASAETLRRPALPCVTDLSQP